jgi:hypothetical protein
MNIHQPFHRFQEKDVKLMGLNDFTSSYELRFGMNITLTSCQALGTEPKAKQAVSFFT